MPNDNIVAMGGVPVDGAAGLKVQVVSSAAGGDASAANQTTQITALGGVTETAPASDTASSGLNGRLQRIAQRLTSLIALVPAALGQGTMAQSFRVVLASDQSSLPVAIPTNIFNGRTTVTTAGTRVVLASSQAISSGVWITALVANTGTIWVGNSTMNAATGGSQQGIPLKAGERVFVQIANINTINIDASVSAEGVTYFAS